MAQRFSKPFYNSKKWKDTRDYILKRDKYMCVVCGSPIDLEVHHKERLSPSNINQPEIALYETNLITLCRDCHFIEHKKETHKRTEIIDEYEFDENGYVIEIIKQV